MWREAAEDLHKILFDLFYRLAVESSDARGNTKYLRELNMVSRLLQALQDTGSLISAPARESLWNVLGALLHNNPRPVDLLLWVQCKINEISWIINELSFRFGQYLATTLPAGSEEPNIGTSQITSELKIDDHSPAMTVANRNEGLSLIYRLLSSERGINLV